MYTDVTLMHLFVTVMIVVRVTLLLLTFGVDDVDGNSVHVVVDHVQCCCIVDVIGVVVDGVDYCWYCC
jgi:hypothetical protein